MSAAQLRTLNLEIKLSNDEGEPHFLQFHSTSTVCTLKSKIFRKARSLKGEKADNYVLVFKQHTKVHVLSDDKVIGNYSWVEEEKNKVITLFLISKEEKNMLDSRRSDSISRISTLEETRLNLHQLGRNHSTRQLPPLPSKTDIRTSREDSDKVVGVEAPQLVRSKSEPILHTVRSVTFNDLTTDQSVLSSHSSDFDSLDDDDDDNSGVYSSAAHDDSAQLSPKVKLRERGSSDKSKGVKTSTPVADKAASSKQKKGRWPLWPKEGKDGGKDGGKDSGKDSSKEGSRESKVGKGVKSTKETSRKKHVSMVLMRTESGAILPAGNPYSSSPECARHGTSTTSAPIPEDETPKVVVKPTPPPTQADYSLKRVNTDLMVEEDAGKLILVGGSVEQLICCLADRDIPDPAYLDDFFYSMTYFTTGSELMRHLRNRYCYIVPPNATPEMTADYDKWRFIIQQRVLNVMRYVIDNHWYHFERDHEFLPLMRDFVEEPAVKANPRSKGLRDVVAARSESTREMNRRSLRGNTSPPPLEPTITASTPPATTSLSASALSPPLSVSSSSPTINHSGSTTTSGSTDLASHRSSSSPIIVWRSRRDTQTDNTHNHHNSNTNSSNNSHYNNLAHGDEPTVSAPTSLTTISSTSTIAAPKPLGKKFKDYRKVSFTRVPPLEMARQLTLIEKELFRAIKPPEVAGSAFKKKNKADIAPNVVQMIDWFNHITTWVQKEVVLTPNLKERTTVLGQFIQVAAHLRELGNLSGAMQIVVALDTVSVKRLSKTWKGLTRKEALVFAALQEAFGSESNYANYRRLIHEPFTTGLIPYIGLVLQDLLMIEEIPTSLTNGMVNFRKMRRFASVLRSEILERQATLTRFNFEPVLAIQEYLARHTPLTEQDLYKWSRLTEPSKMV